MEDAQGMLEVAEEEAAILLTLISLLEEEDECV